MPHRRKSGAKARSHKLGLNTSRSQTRKQERLVTRRTLTDLQRQPEAQE